jgi:hypothetical protein
LDINICFMPKIVYMVHRISPSQQSCPLSIVTIPRALRPHKMNMRKKIRINKSNKQCPMLTLGKQGKRIRKTWPSWNDFEDVVLCCFWMAIILEPITSAQNNVELIREDTCWILWMGMLPPFNRIVMNRNKKSMSHRWSHIQEICIKYHGCYEKIVKRNESGKTHNNDVILWTTFNLAHSQILICRHVTCFS